MPMSSYEVVRRAVEFATPDRLPIRFSTLGLSDTHNVNWNQIGTGTTRCAKRWMNGAARGRAPRWRTWAR